jgi:hypothetical protein
MRPTTFLCIIILQQSNQYYDDDNNDSCITAVNLDLREKSHGRLEKLHNEKLHNLYSSSNIIRMIKSRRMRWEEYIACTERFLVGKPKGKRPLARPMHRWEDSIKMDLQETGCKGMNWIDLAQYMGCWGGGAVMTWQ